MSTNLVDIETPEPGTDRRRSMTVLAALTLLIVLATPFLGTAYRAVVNLPFSAVGVVWGSAHDGTCELHGDLMVTCSRMQGGYERGGTTLGNTWMYGRLDGPARHRHEAKHADQWAMFRASFPVLYGAEWVRADGNPRQSMFEQYAGLRDGGYLRRR
jgi:hypothetical protein